MAKRNFAANMPTQTTQIERKPLSYFLYGPQLKAQGRQLGMQIANRIDYDTTGVHEKDLEYLGSKVQASRQKKDGFVDKILDGNDVTNQDVRSIAQTFKDSKMINKEITHAKLNAQRIEKARNLTRSAGIAQGAKAMGYYDRWFDKSINKFEGSFGPDGAPRSFELAEAPGYIDAVGELRQRMTVAMKDYDPRKVAATMTNLESFTKPDGLGGTQVFWRRRKNAQTIGDNYEAVDKVLSDFNNDLYDDTTRLGKYAKWMDDGDKSFHKQLNKRIEDIGGDYRMEQETPQTESVVTGRSDDGKSKTKGQPDSPTNGLRFSASTNDKTVRPKNTPNTNRYDPMGFEATKFGVVDPDAFDNINEAYYKQEGRIDTPQEDRVYSPYIGFDVPEDGAGTKESREAQAQQHFTTSVQKYNDNNELLLSEALPGSYKGSHTTEMLGKILSPDSKLTTNDMFTHYRDEANLSESDKKLVQEVREDTEALKELGGVSLYPSMKEITHYAINRKNNLGYDGNTKKYRGEIDYNVNKLKLKQNILRNIGELQSRYSEQIPIPEVTDRIDFSGTKSPTKAKSYVYGLVGDNVMEGNLIITKNGEGKVNYVGSDLTNEKNELGDGFRGEKFTSLLRKAINLKGSGSNAFAEGRVRVIGDLRRSQADPTEHMNQEDFNAYSPQVKNTMRHNMANSYIVEFEVKDDAGKLVGTYKATISNRDDQLREPENQVSNVMWQETMNEDNKYVGGRTNSIASAFYDLPKGNSTTIYPGIPGEDGKLAIGLPKQAIVIDRIGEYEFNVHKLEDNTVIQLEGRAKIEEYISDLAEHNKYKNIPYLIEQHNKEIKDEQEARGILPQ